MSLQKKAVPFLISLSFHILLLLILWTIIGSGRSRIETEGMQIEILSVRKSSVARRLISRKTELGWNQYAPPTLNKMKDEIKTENFRPGFSDLQFDLDTPLIDNLSIYNERIMMEGEGYHRMSPHPLILPSSGKLKASAPVLRRSAFGSFQGEETADTLDAIANDLIRKNRSGKIDLILLIDSSGTMRPHILMIAKKLSEMVTKIREANIDLVIGVVSFNRIERKDILKVYDLTDDISQVKRVLFSIRCIGDERALNALAETLRKLKLRDKSDKTFLLVTDERMKGKVGVDEIIELAKKIGVRIYVLGVDDPQQIKLAEQTEGIWFELLSFQEKLIW